MRWRGLRFALGLALLLGACEGVPPRWRDEPSRYPLPEPTPPSPGAATNVQEDAMDAEIRRLQEELAVLDAFEETTSQRVEHLQYLITTVPETERAALQADLDNARSVRRRQVKRRMNLLDRLEGLQWRRYELRFKPLDP